MVVITRRTMASHLQRSYRNWCRTYRRWIGDNSSPDSVRLKLTNLESLRTCPGSQKLRCGGNQLTGSPAKPMEVLTFKELSKLKVS